MCCEGNINGEETSAEALATTAEMNAETFTMLEQMLSPKIDVKIRAAAATAAAAGSGEPAFRHELGTTELGKEVLKRLLALTADDGTSRFVMSALVNTAEDEAAAKALVSLNAVPRTCQSILDPEARTLISLHSALLSNLTRFPAGRDALCAGAVAEALTLSMLARPKYIPSLLWVSNLAAAAPGRSLLLQLPGGDSGVAPLDPVLEVLCDADEARRFAAASAVRNCALAEDCHEALLTDTAVLGTTLARFVTKKRQIDADEMVLAPRQVRAAYDLDEKLTPEPIEGIRTLLAEGLLLLCKSVDGRDALRAEGSYPVLRDWHLEEESEKVKNIIESIVDRTKLLDEEGDEEPTDAVSEPPQISEMTE